MFRTLVTPESVLWPFSANTGEGMPHRAMAVPGLPAGSGQSGHVAREYPGQGRQVAGPVHHGLGQVADGLLARGDGVVELAHRHSSLLENNGGGHWGRVNGSGVRQRDG